MKSWMRRARESAGLAPSDCARALYLSVEDYLLREDNPGMLTVDELVALGFIFDESARWIVIDGLKDALL